MPIACLTREQLRGFGIPPGGATITQAATPKKEPPPPRRTFKVTGSMFQTPPPGAIYAPPPKKTVVSSGLLDPGFGPGSALPPPAAPPPGKMYKGSQQLSATGTTGAAGAATRAGTPEAIQQIVDAFTYTIPVPKAQPAPPPAGAPPPAATPVVTQILDPGIPYGPPPPQTMYIMPGPGGGGGYLEGRAEEEKPARPWWHWALIAGGIGVLTGVIKLPFVRGGRGRSRSR